MVGDVGLDPLGVVPQRQPGGLVEGRGSIDRLGRLGDVADAVQGQGVQASCSSVVGARSAWAAVSLALSLAGRTNR